MNNFTRTIFLNLVVLLGTAAGIGSAGAQSPSQIISSLPGDHQSWINQSCPKSLGPSLWSRCVKREAAAFQQGMPDISKLSSEDKRWINQSCPKSLGPSLWSRCVKREAAAFQPSPAYYWCATTFGAFKATQKYCDSQDGKIFSSESQAKNEHKRLKATTRSWCATAQGVKYTTDSNCRSNNGKTFSRRGDAFDEHDRLKKKTTQQSSPTYAWCATAQGAFKATQKYCDSQDGKIFSSEWSAKNEHARLKKKTAQQPSPAYGWCATALGVKYTTDSNCESNNGKTFSSEWLAKHEHKQQQVKNEKKLKILALLFLFALVTLIWIFARLRAGRQKFEKPSSSQSGDKGSGWGQPNQRVVPRLTPFETANKQKIQSQERSLGIERAWTIERKRDHVRQEFNKWNGRIVGLPPGEKRNEAQEKLRICGELMAQYGL
ncbi:hypothetical protein ACYVVI_00985 [Arenicellales bacterium IMCC57338]